MTNNCITIKGASVNNLKKIDVEIPRNKFIVITGLSGSGKSSLAFDTLYAEGQRRYVESLSAYARQFLGKLQKPECDYIKDCHRQLLLNKKSAHAIPEAQSEHLLKYMTTYVCFSQESDKQYPQFRGISLRSIPLLM